MRKAKGKRSRNHGDASVDRSCLKPYNTGRNADNVGASLRSPQMFMEESIAGWLADHEGGVVVNMEWSMEQGWWPTDDKDVAYD